MPSKYCPECDKIIDLDTDVEHSREDERVDSLAQQYGPTDNEAREDWEQAQRDQESAWRS